FIIYYVFLFFSDYFDLFFYLFFFCFFFYFFFFFFFSSRRRHTRLQGDWSSDVCSSDLSRRAPATELLSMGAAVPRGARRRDLCRSEERRVGKECRSRWSPYQ